MTTPREPTVILSITTATRTGVVAALRSALDDLTTEDGIERYEYLTTEKDNLAALLSSGAARDGAAWVARLSVAVPDENDGDTRPRIPTVIVTGYPAWEARNES